MSLREEISLILDAAGIRHALVGALALSEADPSSRRCQPDVAAERRLGLAILVAFLLGIVVSVVAAVLEYGVLAFFVIPALVVFWAWVALGTCAGMFTIHRFLVLSEAWQAHAVAQLTALLCGACLRAGAHDHVLSSVRQLLRFNQDLAAYYLVGLQLVYFVAAVLGSALISVAMHASARLLVR